MESFLNTIWGCYCKINSMRYAHLHAGATRFRYTQWQGILAIPCPYGRAECGRTKIREIGSPVRSGAETAYTSIDGWPKASGSPSSSIPAIHQRQCRRMAPPRGAISVVKLAGVRGGTPPIHPGAQRRAPFHYRSIPRNHFPIRLTIPISQLSLHSSRPWTVGIEKPVSTRKNLRPVRSAPNAHQRGR